MTRQATADPAPPVIERKRRDRLRMLAGTLVRHLVFGDALPEQERRNPPEPDPDPRTTGTPLAPPQNRKRESARARQQRQRDRRKREAELSALAEAQRLEREALDLEQRSEWLTPAVLRNPIIVPAVLAADGSVLRSERMLRGPLVEIAVTRNRAGQITHVRSGHGCFLPKFSDRQNRAARQLQLDWRDVGTGCGAPAVDYSRARGGGSDGENKAMTDQIDIRVRLEGAFAHIGAFTPAVRRVVLDRVPIHIWADEVEPAKTVEEATGWIRAALTRLAGFYWPSRPETQDRRGFLTFGPARETYSTEIQENELDA